MKKHSYLVKILKSIYLNINHFLEKYLNKLNIIGNKNQKKPRSLINRLIITFLFIFFLGMSYLSIPNLYSKSKIKLEIENQISQRYDSTFLLSNNLNYRIFPVPHFEFLNSELFHMNDKIADLINLKVFISFNNFFSNKINVKNIILDGANFNPDNNNLNFFLKILKLPVNKNKFLIKNTNFFYKNLEKEILFVNKILNYDLYYDLEKKLNILMGQGEIFNIPYQIDIENNNEEKKLYLKILSKIIKTSIENKFDYSKEPKIGFIKFTFNNKDIASNYEITNDTFKFSNNKNQDNYKFNGIIDFKPFYLSADFNLESINFENIFRENSFVLELLKSEILNNENINLDIGLMFNNSEQNDDLKNIDIKLKIEEGLIYLKGSKLNWINAVQIELLNSAIYIDQNNIGINGSLKIDISKIDDVYSYFQTGSKYRAEFSNLNLDFNYDFNKKQITFENIVIDQVSNQNVSKFFDEFNKQNKLIENKVNFKKLMNDFFKIYAG